MTFRQAEKIDPLPTMLAYGELDRHLRNRIWDVLFSRFSGLISSTHDDAPHFTQQAYKVAVHFLREVSHYPMDEAEDIASDPSKFIYHLKEIVFKGKYYDCLEAVQFFVRVDPYPDRWSIASLLAHVLNDPLSPYIVVDFPPKTIIPRGDENEQEAFEKNWAIIKASTFEGAKTHLRKSVESLNANDAVGAVREAIHAVEGAAQLVSAKSNASLGDALNVLKKDKGLNSVLGEAFSKLYGYTNNEKGIRHALRENDNANVGQEEALFMFSSCTAFVAYLARKYPEKV